ncbi:PKD domain containing protein [Halorubrum lipolyticum DSM 21995]|uniref:PKD domain containing protein n=2 Tax=Halorubrum lipolyticum TaxID=368624 RepID=M0NPL7_9EURY|nr:PKD domain containing protein [Halorubrum lipolyticum DSM 21995]
MAIAMVLAPIAGAAGTVGATQQLGDGPSHAIGHGETVQQTGSNPSNPSELPGNFINATESVDVWDRAVFPLRADRSDDADTATSVDNIYLEAAAPGLGAQPLQGSGDRNLVVYPDDATIDLTFDVAGTDASADDLAGEEVHLISAKVESSEETELPSAFDPQSLREFVRDEADSETVAFENASTATVGNDGSVDFEYDLTEGDRGAGSYMFMAVTTANGGIDTSNQNLSVPGEATVLGVDTAAVQRTSSEVTVADDDETHDVGDNVSFDVDAGLTTEDGRVDHAIALWNESAVAGERLTIIAPDTVSTGTTADDFTINHTIENVAGVQNVDGDASAFGRTLTDNRRSGVFELADIVSFLANEGEFSGPETNRVGSTTINASVTSVNATGSSTTIEVETLESFEPGEYVAVHMAMADGDLTEVSSSRTDITLVNESGPGQGPGDNPGQGPGDNPGQGPGDNPGQGPGDNPGQGPGDNPGQGPGDNPGQGQGPGLGPGSVVEENPDRIRELVSVPEDVNPIVAEQGELRFDEENDTSVVEFAGRTTAEQVSINDEVNGTVTTVRLDGNPGETGSPPGQSVSTLQIAVPEEAADTESELVFNISRTELDDVESPEDLRVNRFADGEWGHDEIETEVIDEPGEPIRIEAETPGFSFFSVTAVSEPEAVIDAPDQVGADEEFTLDGSESTDRYGEVVSYDWEVGDESQTGETVTAALEEPGTVDIELTVTNDAGETSSTTVPITVEESTDGDDAADGGAQPIEEPSGFPVLGSVLVIAFIALLAGALFVRRRN